MVRDSCNIRPAHANDIEALVTLKAHAWRQAYQDILPGAVIEGVLAKDQRGFFHEAIAHPINRIIVAVQKDTVAGYCIYGPPRPQTFGETPEMLTGIKGQIWSLYIAPQFQGYGIGQNLFSYAAKQLSKTGLTPYIVWMFRDNSQAAHFYHKMGGKPFLESSNDILGYECAGSAFIFTEELAKNLLTWSCQGRKMAL